MVDQVDELVQARSAQRDLVTDDAQLKQRECRPATARALAETFTRRSPEELADAEVFGHQADLLSSRSHFGGRPRRATTRGIGLYVIWSV